MRFSVRRVLAISAVAVVILAIAVLAVLHMPATRARVFSFIVQELASRYNLDLRAGQLHYNLFTRTAELTDVRLAAVGQEQEPFVTAGRASVALPWSIFRGILAFERIELEDARVNVVRRQDGSSNLPQVGERGGGPRGPLTLDIRSVVLRGLDFAYADEVRDLNIDAGGLHANLERRAIQLRAEAAGPVEIQRGVRVRIGEHRIDAEPIAGRMGLDGSTLSLDGIRLATSEGTVDVSGKVLRVFDDPSLELRFDGTADVARAADWGTLPLELGGTTAVHGTIAGPAAQPTVEIEAKSDAVRLGGLQKAAVDAAVTVTPSAVTIRRASVRGGAGVLDASGTIELGDAGVTELRGEWRDLPAATILRVLGQSGPGPDRANRRIAASMTGRLTMTRRADEPMTLTVENRAAAPAFAKAAAGKPTAAADAAPLSGKMSLDVRNGQWTLQQTHTLGAISVDGPLRGGISGDDFASATVEGALTVESSDVASAADAIEHLDVNLPGIVSNIRGPLNAIVNLSGQLNALHAQATVSSEALVLPGLSPADVRADVSVTPGRVDVPALSARIGQASLTGNALVDLQGQSLAGAFALDAPEAAEVLTAVPENARLTGPISAAATLGGSPSAPDVRTEVNGHDLTFAGQAIDSLTATARITGDTAYVDSLSLTTGEGTLTGTGSYAWGNEAYTAKLEGANLAWRGQLGGEAETEVRVNTLAFAGAGTLAQPGGAGQVTFHLAGGPAGDIVENGVADVQLDGGNATIDARLPSLGAQVTGTILTSAPYTFDATAEIAQLDLAPLAAIAGLPPDGVLGRLSVTATAHGDGANAAETSEVVADIQQVAATVGEVPIWLASPPAKITWRKDDLRVEPVTLGVGAGTLTASGRLAPGEDTGWESAFDGELGDLVRIARGVTDVPAELAATGNVSARWKSTGSVDRSTATLTLAGGQVNWAELPPVTAVALQAGFDGTTITLESLTGTWQEGGITATATMPYALLDGSEPSADTRGHAQLNVTNLTQTALQPWLDAAVLARIAGRVSASFEGDILGTRLSDIEGTLQLDEAVLNLADIEVQQARPSRMSIGAGRLTMDDVSWTAGGGPLALTGEVVLDAPSGTVLNLALKGDLNLGLLSAFAPTTWTAGSAIVDVKIDGPANDIDAQGQIELRDGEVAIFDPRLILYDLQGIIALDRERVRFGGIAGSLNGGSIRLDGQLGFGGALANTGQLIIEVGQVALEYPARLQSEVNGLLTLMPRGQDWQLGGDVRIVRSSYRENISLPALATARRTRPPVAVDAEPTFFDRLRLNLFVATEEDLRIDNNYGRLEAGAGVRVIGTATEPALSGRVTMRESGQVFLAGRTFRLERGAISFTSPTRIEPELDFELRTIAGGIDVAVTLTGTLDQLKTEVRSTSPESTDRQAQEALYGNLGTEDAATLLSAELLGATGRAVGLDTLRIERGTESDEFRNDPTLIAEEIDDDLATRLTLSKRVRPDVEVIVSRSLRESGGVSAAVSYNVRRNIELRLSQREDTDRALALRHEITFGGDAARAPASATPQPRISTVRISGEPGRPEAEIRVLLRLNEGDRFAFHDWQTDVDRIKASYTERGYYEARVRPTRQPSEDGQSVTLDYRIDQGPKTSFAIEGHDLHQGLIQELQDAWSRAIFDRFLVDDVRARVASDLMSEGYIGSKVEPTIVQPDPQTKQVRIAISTGTHVGGREIRFEGNTGFSNGRLEGVVAEQGLSETVWLDPPRLAGAIATFYQEQGYLGVNVSAGNPVVEGNRGVLPVKIDEGRRFAFAKPTLQGVGEEDRQIVLDRITGFTLREGAPYDAAAVDLARQRVERFYLARGFNSARIQARSTSDQEAATVSVAFSIEEGLQQVLREVVTEGGGRTSAGVVRRALRLTEDAPVDLGQWAQARKRMYDTNVFAQVDIEPVAIEQTAEDKAAGIEPVHAVVRLVEYPTWRLRYGLQLNDIRTGDEDIQAAASSSRQQNLGVLADIQNRNIFGRAVAGGLAMRVERDRQIASLFGSNGSFFGLPIRTQTFLFTSRERDREPFDIKYDRVGTSIEQRWQALRRTELVYGYRYDQTRTYDPNPAADDPFPLDATSHTGKVTAGLIFDHRDDPFSATRGWFTAANYEHAARVLGGDSRNSKLLVQQYYFHPVGKMVLASRAQIGAAFGKDPLIQENAFVLGGATTVRGYAEDGLGPRDEAGFPGGHALIALNQELRFPIKGWLNGVGFIDAGNVFASRSDLSLSDLSVGYGFGIRLDTPFAMLRVDFGVPGSMPPGTARRANHLGSGRWYIGIGHIF